ncbi:MAG: bifunctional DNA primase/polymerase [Terriglobales bacterium]
MVLLTRCSPVTNFLEVALRNAKRDFRVHPLHPYVAGRDSAANARCKRAILEGWPSKATTDEGQIRIWASIWPGANCGVMAGEDLAIVESDHLPTLEARLGFPIPECYRVQARENRPHCYFLQTERARSSFVAGKSVAGVFEFKIGNLYVLSEGSTHPTGAVYKITGDVPLYLIPNVIVDGLERIKGAPPAASGGDGIARPAAVEKFVRRFTAYCDRVGAAVTEVRTLPSGKILISTSPCLLFDDHDGGVGITPDGVRCVQCFHARCSVGWAKWKTAVEAKHKVPMALDGEIQWQK